MTEMKNKMAVADNRFEVFGDEGTTLQLSKINDKSPFYLTLTDSGVTNGIFLTWRELRTLKDWLRDHYI